jgi:hypothetical protein
MWTPSEDFPGTRTVRRTVAAAALSLVSWLPVLSLAALPAAPALAAPAPQEAAAPATAAGRAELRQQIERRYEVLPLADGELLKARQERLGVRSVELRGGSVAINGEAVNHKVLRDWLGEAEATPILQLAGLDQAAQRNLLGIEDAGSLAPPEAPVPAPGAEAPVPDAALPAEAPPAPPAPDVSGLPAPPSPPEPPEAPSGHTAIKVAGSVTVEEGEVAEDVVVFGGPVRILGEVLGDVSSIGGPVTIEGKVGGSVSAVGNTVRLGPKAVVEGEITSVWGRVERAPGSRVGGKVSEISGSGVSSGGDRINWDGFDGGWPWLLGGVSDFVGAVLGLLMLGLFACLALLLARVPMARIEAKIASDPWPSLGVGLLALLGGGLLLLPVTILLIITIVGCVVVLLYPVIFLFLLLGALLGYAAIALRVGRFLEARFNWQLGSPYLHILVGVAVIGLPSVLGHLVGLANGFFGFFSGLLVFTGCVIELTVWLMGFGAFLLTRFGLGPRAPRPVYGVGLPPAPISPISPNPPVPPPPATIDPLLGDPLPPPPSADGAPGDPPRS